jgi:hypothetical protein
MSEYKRTTLELARDVAHMYRRTLMRIAPNECAILDDMARKAGQRWAAPTYLPAEAADNAEEAVMSPKDIADLWGIPVGTIYGWVSKGFLKPSPVDEDGDPVKPGAPAKYLVGDVMSAANRRRARQLDIA